VKRSAGFAWPSAKAAGNKYSAKQMTCQAGHSHPSKKEAGRCNALHLLQKAGEISDLRIGPKFFFEVNGQTLLHDNGRRAVYTPDFVYRQRGGQLTAEDSKGMRVRDWSLRKALFRACYPHIEVIES
jgi:hypothetical protein